MPVSDINLDTIRQNWPNVVTEVHKHKPSLINALEKANPVKTDGSNLELEIGKINAFQKDLIENNRRLIEKSLQSVFHREMKLKCNYHVEENEPVVTERENLSKEEKEEILKKLRSESETIAKLIDEFDLELY